MPRLRRSVRHEEANGIPSLPILHVFFVHRSRQTDCTPYLLSLYAMPLRSPSRWLRSPSSGDLHGRFSAMSAMAMRPPGSLPTWLLTSSVHLPVTRPGIIIGPAFQWNRRRESRDAPPSNFWSVGLRDDGDGRLLALDPQLCSLRWTRGVLLCRAPKYHVSEWKPWAAWFRLERLPWARTTWYQRVACWLAWLLARPSKPRQLKAK
jgi:hypothetical protein